jgi:hypothetical protein
MFVASFSKWDRDAYQARVGEDEAARRRGAIMAEQWGHQLAEALASYIAALGGKLELIADIGGHLLNMPANPAA